MSVAEDEADKQGTRLLKYQCRQHGYIIRVTRKWIDGIGAPLCPACKQPFIKARKTARGSGRSH